MPRWSVVEIRYTHASLKAAAADALLYRPAAHAAQLMAPQPVNVLVTEPAAHTAHAAADALLADALLWRYVRGVSRHHPLLIGLAEMATSGASFVIALSGVVHEVVGARSDHKVLHS